jgi:cysteine desulfurase / selenocysteine lyase
VDALARREQQLKRELLRRLEAVPGVRIHTPLAGESVGIVLITHERLGAAELAGRLEREHGILTRAGLHCAPEAHQVLGTLETGAVRMSLGWASSIADVELAAAAMAAITGDS